MYIYIYIYIYKDGCGCGPHGVAEWLGPLADAKRVACSTNK